MNNKGKTIKFSCYEIYKNKKIGIGNFSQIYLGKCLNTNTIKKNHIPEDGLVAVKILSLSNFDNTIKEKIKDEILIMQMIKKNPHPNIVNCYDVIDSGDFVYIFMEYCNGGDLNNLLGRPFDEKIAKKYLFQIVNGLSHLYNNNIIHADIKPKNVLVTNNKDTLKICDFGLSIILNSKKDENVCIDTNILYGSPLYMAPELFNNNLYDYAIDIWSTGLILYEMIFGYHPLIYCNDIIELKKYILNNDISIPKTNISSDCKNILKLFLDKNDKNRIKIKDILKHRWFKINYNS